MEANENSGERKIKQFKVQRAGARGLSSPSSFFPRSSAARRTGPLTEGLEQAKFKGLFFRGKQISHPNDADKI